MQPIARNHIAVYGTTLRLIQSEPFVDRKKQLEDLERIEQMIYWNTNEIKTAHEHKKLKESLLFTSIRELNERIVILHHQRDRIYRIWDRQLEKMKFNQY